MRNFIIVLLFLSGCSSIDELVSEAEIENMESERMHNAETLCLGKKKLGHTVEYDVCIEKVLGINKKQKTQHAMHKWNQLPDFEFPLEPKELSEPERICNKYGFTTKTPQRSVCLENASGYGRN